MSGTRDFINLVDWFNKIWEMPMTMVDWDAGALMYNAPSFPPVNVLLNKDTKDLIFEFAVAGYKEEEMDINFSGDYLILKLQINKENGDEKIKIIHNGIRKQDVCFRYYTPSDKYDQEGVVANLANGVLSVKVPAREEAQKKKIVITK